MESHGFEGINLSSKSKIQARLLLKIRTHYCPLQFDGESSGGSTAGFKVFERDDGRTISLGWQDREMEGMETDVMRYSRCLSKQYVQILMSVNIFYVNY
ncbi:hypothetical protein GBA52_026123 [Prunus armeniaca]|nr:hypothetical protein GBA52_026123 [Prunus armeniaca]